MNAIKFVEEVIGKNKRLFEVPPYQRNYAWEKNQCEQLLKDILVASQRKKSHFMGTILYVNYESNSVLDRCLVIDGQQRLTTMLVLLKILLDIAIEENNDSIKDEITDLLYNRHCPEQYKIKLKPIKKDESQLVNIFSNNFDDIDKTSNIYKNYRTLLVTIKNALNSGIQLSNIFEGIKFLTIVEIPLKQGEDDAQAIFESINSTGKSLTMSDKLRNYLLMNPKTIEEQHELHKNSWLPLEETLSEEMLEKYFYDYLVMKQSKTLKESELYDEYKKYIEENNYSKKEALEELVYYSRFYELLLGKSKKFNSDLNSLCATFGDFRHNTIYSFLLKICEDYDKKIIDLNDLTRIFKLFSNYALRRQVMNIPSSSLRRFYSNLYYKIFKNPENKDNYYETIVTYMCTINTSDRFPTDIAFKDSLMNEKIYTKNSLTKYLLEKVENFGSKEIVDFENLTIEHIMPQELKQDWKLMLGDNFEEIHEKYLHTLGNLSMTGYNSEYSNASFAIKKVKMTEFNSKLLILNSEILENDIWNEEIIIKRADRISNLIIDLYPMPTEINKDIKFDLQTEYTLADLEESNFSLEDNDLKMIGYKFFDQEVKVRYNWELLNSISLNLYNLDKSILEQLANENYSFERGSRPLLTKNKTLLREPLVTFAEKTNSDIYIECNHSSSATLKVVATFVKKYDIDLKNVTVIYKKNDNN